MTEEEMKLEEKITAGLSFLERIAEALEQLVEFKTAEVAASVAGSPVEAGEEAGEVGEEDDVNLDRVAAI